MDRTDVDLAGGLLTVRETKFGKSRQVPVHASTITALRRYARERDLQRPAPSTAAFLVSTRGTRLDSHNLPRTFVQLLSAADITASEGRRRPRLHDLRHTFATTTLLEWYRDGADVQAKLPLLTTYLGHADPKSTYWYLSGSPELLSLAAVRLEHSFGGRP
ncbi:MULTISPECIES: tyrosine-type recombinase/integrase [unclassified Streptomyces]|uniref:tyrosine-type recombinase/integrase n=1 Tax=unclassified Streptomyces TaxID=2593676 RepID=UPI002DD9EE54|nr:tyrosine-type recombinase/integrase [Streptomyces sp. NBC_01750]WSB05230.1 tyrosine-type recombinase/integrase [Streptomyces sp. NBC_01794]WSD38046.1 tyrosine-type recombinase/integrase [Streptomyces sp. NBC_01750]